MKENKDKEKKKIKEFNGREHGKICIMKKMNKECDK